MAVSKTTVELAGNSEAESAMVSSASGGGAATCSSGAVAFKGFKRWRPGRAAFKPNPKSILSETSRTICPMFPGYSPSKCQARSTSPALVSEMCFSRSNCPIYFDLYIEGYPLRPTPPKACARREPCCMTMRSSILRCTSERIGDCYVG